MSKKRDYHVIPNPGGGWSVRREGAERASSVFDRKADALVHGRQLARSSRTELIEHGRDGRIRETTSRSRDSLPPRNNAVTHTAPPKGYGSLGGKFTVRQGVDITKPIYEQTTRNAKGLRGDHTE
jgi:Uncharacterized protein conserved in bacteria (DUF2188)